MENKVRVYGIAQNSNVLGIVNAYLMIYPHAKLEDLRKAFPVDLNPFYSNNEFLFFNKRFPVKSYKHEELNRNVFTEDNEIIHLKDGTEVYFMKIWQDDAYDKICNHAKQYGIEVAEFKQKDGYTKGGFRLEYINGFTPIEFTNKPAKSKSLLLITVFVAIAFLLYFIFFANSSKPSDNQSIVLDTVDNEVVDSVLVEKVEEVETDFNSAYFEKSKSDLNDEAKTVLDKMATLLESHSNIKVRIVGHASDEGSYDFNMKLSEDRAKVVVDYLISKGIDAGRLLSEGKGSSNPVDVNNRVANRRTEFEIIK